MEGGGIFFFFVCDKNIHSQKFSANPDGVHVTHLRKSTGKQTPKLRLLALYCSSGAIHVKTWPTLSYIIFELKYMPHASVLSESSHLKGQTTLIMHTHTKKKTHYNHCIVPDLIQKYKTNVYVAWLGHPAYEPRVLVPLYVCEAKTHHRKMPCTGYWGSYRINKRAKRRRITVRLA